MTWIFVFFFASGFCSILYELIWLRLSMAQFGVTSALTSIVLSMFMAGLGGGSLFAGKIIRRSTTRFPLRLYAIAELLIAIAALLVPLELRAGSASIANLPLSSGAHYLLAAAILAVTLIPWCASMGATIPLAMLAIDRQKSFSFLYLANVFGSVVGCALPLALIELYGFHRTLLIGSMVNFAIAIGAWAIASRLPRTAPHPEQSRPAPSFAPGKLPLLFATGFVTMGMELVWIRIFTPFVGPVVYSFALILGAYLVATFAGSRIYRSYPRELKSTTLWLTLAPLSLLPLLAAHVGFELSGWIRVLIGVMPVAAVIGFVTPMLVDQCSRGDAALAGRAYAVNVAGCIAGPLISGFVLLPLAGERWSILLFALPWLLLASRKNWKPTIAFAAASLALFALTNSFENLYEPRIVLRDNTATVIATGEAMERELLVNGIGMTRLTPITKMMAHITSAWLDPPPRDALVICFGMGTTFRSFLTWQIHTTAIELVPSVPKLIGFFHPASENLLASPLAHVVVDDGRRFLERSPDMFDIIVIDPPPPVTAAASSLLYSTEFYRAAKRRLRPNGILQQWLPYSVGRAFGDDVTRAAVAKSLRQSFPYVRVFRALDGLGWHYLASLTPLPARTPRDLAARMPHAPIQDMLEWGPEKTPEAQFQRMFEGEVSLDSFIDKSPAAPVLTDDQPINEYYQLRRWRERLRR